LQQRRPLAIFTWLLHAVAVIRNRPGEGVLQLAVVAVHDKRRSITRAGRSTDRPQYQQVVSSSLTAWSSERPQNNEIIGFQIYGQRDVDAAGQ
jgi:hypothetical protein